MWRPQVRTPEGFEGFYQATRLGLLHQCYALTGDLPASQRAVRDAMVVARHHWRKASRLEHPEDWVRPLAWTRAQRRSQARRWSRQQGIDAADRATLDALGALKANQRRVLLLALLTSAPLDGVAREAGVTRAVAERDLQTATAQFAVHRDVPSTSVRSHVDRLAEGLDAVRWPRPSTVAREGAARRRTHTLVGAAAVVAALVAAGTVVTESGGAAPALANAGLTQGAQTAADRPATPSATAEPDPLTAQALLGVDQLSTALPGRWTQGATTANADGNGLAFTCQTARYADPQGVGALVRTFTGTGPRGSTLTAGQSAEASADDTAAQRAYTTTLDWYAGCASPRLQLISTATVTGVGEQATLLVLRNWNDPQSTQVVGVARSGRLTTSVVTTRPDRAGSPPSVDLADEAALLGDAVTGLCALPDHGACTTTASVQDAAALPVGTQPGLIGAVDLPPISGVAGPWAGNDPAPATQNPAATRCDGTAFTGGGVSGAVTRTFLIPSAEKLSAEFGLTETAGVLEQAKARRFVDTVRHKLAGCHDRDIGTDVTQVLTRTSATADLTVWRLDIDVSKKQTVHFLMAIIRQSGTVAQLTFVPSDNATLQATAFTALAERAQQRLAYLVG